jgi:hypothetical protein
VADHEPAPAPTDARRCRRLPPRGATNVEVFRAPDGLGPNVAVRVLDVSASGACLTLSESLPAGQLVGVALFGARSPLPVACAASVVWSKDAGNGTFVTGVRSARRPARRTSPPSPARLRRSSGIRKRAWFRRGNGPAVPRLCQPCERASLVARVTTRHG